LSALQRGHAHERWQRVAIASAKQCRRAVLPAIDPPCSFADWLARSTRGLRLLLVEPSAEAALVVPLRDALRGSPATVECVVGPEGGWAPAEQAAAAAAGCVLVSLGATTLRADAAGLVALSLIHFASEV
jgi:16S rRNA (uracil1498-N3)-methyltransferase